MRPAPPQGPARRVFIALWPSDSERAALAAAAACAVSECGGRPVPPGNLHVTLAFLGAVAEPRLPELAALCAEVAAGWHAAAPGLEFAALDYWRGAQILCALAAGCGDAAEALAALVRAAALARGFSPDLKPFRPHVTVARQVRRAPARRELRKVHWAAEQLALIESRTEPCGPVYSVLKSALLVAPEKMRKEC